MIRRIIAMEKLTNDITTKDIVKEGKLGKASRKFYMLTDSFEDNHYKMSL